MNKTLLTNHPRISSDPDILNGIPAIRGTRIPVSIVLEMFDGGLSIKDMIAQYPQLKEDDIHEALRFSADLLATTR